MSTYPYPATARDLLYLQDPHHRHILLRGEIIELPFYPLGPGLASSALSVRLFNHVEQYQAGVVLGGCGFVVARNPDSVLGPAIAFLCAARLADDVINDDYVEGPPDLGVELVSPLDPQGHAERMVNEHLAAGTPCLWQVDAIEQTVAVYRPGSIPRLLVSGDTLDGEELLPGFSLPLPEIFR